MSVSASFQEVRRNVAITYRKNTYMARAVLSFALFGRLPYQPCSVFIRFGSFRNAVTSICCPKLFSPCFR
jgi:hypothetical protein